MTEAIRILTVCTGNLCRSPFAEAVLRRALSSEYEISSAGTFAREGQEAPVAVMLVGEAEGLDLHPHRARALTSEVVESSDLLLGMGVEHRRAAVEHAPSVVRRAFTLSEFARLTEALTDEELAGAASGGSSRRERLAAILRLVSSQRGATSPVAAGADDIVDPYGKPDETYRLMADQIGRALPSVLRALSFVG